MDDVRLMQMHYHHQFVWLDEFIVQASQYGGTAGYDSIQSAWSQPDKEK